eukprot:6398862-Prymnesium_polylepis.2
MGARVVGMPQHVPPMALHQAQHFRERVVRNARGRRLHGRNRRLQKVGRVDDLQDGFPGDNVREGHLLQDQGQLVRENEWHRVRVEGLEHPIGGRVVAVHGECHPRAPHHLEALAPAHSFSVLWRLRAIHC